jgi:Leucine-rich repeat (LRR) protein
MSTLLLQFGIVRSINLNNNRLTTLPAGMFPYCSRLTELSVCNNRLREIPRSILLLPNLISLNLSMNHIKEVAVIKAPLMEVLKLSHNHVRYSACRLVVAASEVLPPILLYVGQISARQRDVPVGFK